MNTTCLDILYILHLRVKIPRDRRTVVQAFNVNFSVAASTCTAGLEVQFFQGSRMDVLKSQSLHVQLHENIKQFS